MEHLLNRRKFMYISICDKTSVNRQPECDNKQLGSFNLYHKKICQAPEFFIVRNSKNHILVHFPYLI